MTLEEIKQRARQIKVIALDMDGTVLDGEHKMTPHSREVLQTLVDRGYIVVPASGRGFWGLREEVIGVPQIRYVISSNGAILTDGATGERLIERDIPAELVARLARTGLDHEGANMHIDDGEPDYDERGGYIGCYSEESYLSLYDEPRWGWTLCRREEYASRMEQAAKEGKRFFKVAYYFGPSRSYAYYDDFFARRFPQLNAFHSSGERQYECGPKGTSKGEALRWLCEHLALAPAQVLAMGDNGNDVSMITYAGVGVAMANSPRWVRDLADYVAGPNDQEGAARLLEELFLS